MAEEMFPGDALVSFQCTAKIYFVCGMPPRQHSCHLSVWSVNGTHFLVLEGQGIGRKRIQLTPTVIQQVAANRIDEGRLTIVFTNHEWDQIMVADVSSKPALRKCCNLLENLISGGTLLQGSSSHGSGREMKSPGSHGMVGSYSPARGSARKKSRLNLSGNPSYGARMLDAAHVTSTPGAGSTISFYKTTSINSPVPEPFLPQPRTYTPNTVTPHMGTPNASGYFGSSRRSLTFDLRSELTENSDSNSDFKIQKGFRRPSETGIGVAKRLPLADLPGQRTSTPHRNGILMQQREEEDDLEGFTNLGNTCYMNAVLQSLLGLEPFAIDLLNHLLVKNVHPRSLYRTLFLLLKSKRAKDSYESQKILLKRIKAVISARAAKFSGYRQQDAHELLSHCLDQLREDVDHISVPIESAADGSSTAKGDETVCPVLRNFECEVLRTITCKDCGNSSKRAEVVYDFGLQLPKSVLLKPNEQANLQQLFELYFSSEDVEYTCASCQGNAASLSHQISRLPRILILHLKRYGYNTSKRVDNIRIPRMINVGHLCVDNPGPPCAFRGYWPRDPTALSTLSQAEDKENLPQTLPRVRMPEVSKDINDFLLAPERTPDSKAEERVPSADRVSGNGSETPGELSPRRIKGTPTSCQGAITPIPSVACGSRRSISIPGSEGDSIGSHPKSILGKRHRQETSDSDSSTADQMEAVDLTEAETKSQGVLDEFDRICTSKEVVFEFDQTCGNPQPALECTAQSDSPATTTSIAETHSGDPPVTGLPNDVNQEEEAFRRAVEESLKAQPTHLQLLHEMGLSEEEQLRLALELSIQESCVSDPLPVAASPSPCKLEIASTPTPEATSRETYRLMSIVSHLGRGSGGGHYISDVYSVVDGMWKSFNDSQVTECREEDVRQRRQASGYIFFYLHKSIYSSVVKHLKH